MGSLVSDKPLGAINSIHFVISTSRKGEYLNIFQTRRSVMKRTIVENCMVIEEITER